LTRLLFSIFFSFFISVCFCQQAEQTFIVKKRKVEAKKEFPKVFDLKLGGIGDTICGSIVIDLSPAEGYYDSISLFNLKKHREAAGKNTYFYGVTTKSGHAIITFFKKEKDGSYKMVYFRNWVIHCLDKY
jgi:hypothetical protein